MVISFSVLDYLCLIFDLPCVQLGLDEDTEFSAAKRGDESNVKVVNKNEYHLQTIQQWVVTFAFLSFVLLLRVILTQCMCLA